MSDNDVGKPCTAAFSLDTAACASSVLNPKLFITFGYVCSVSNRVMAPSRDVVNVFMAAPSALVTPTPATIDLTLSPKVSATPIARLKVDDIFLSVALNIALMLNFSAIAFTFFLFTY
ncbi:hypothetical protein [Faecalicoccus pleomorphus]|uniref:hypothetical protein n=1 Tax=Faecalicoccus pleomorphus TaxID=1323 RepID=UPI001EF5B4E7|nr:hypothetical protein [Faecalicoccus pleomorphus]